jgi:hypothetical protein
MRYSVSIKTDGAPPIRMDPMDMKRSVADLGGTVLPGSPADFGKLIADDTEKWAKVIRAAGIKPER